MTGKRHFAGTCATNVNFADDPVDREAIRSHRATDRLVAVNLPGSSSLLPQAGYVSSPTGDLRSLGRRGTPRCAPSNSPAASYTLGWSATPSRSPLVLSPDRLRATPLLRGRPRPTLDRSVRRWPVLIRLLAQPAPPRGQNRL